MKSEPSFENASADLPGVGHCAPDTVQEMGAEISRALKVDGYAYVRWPVSLDGYEAAAGEIGTITARADIKIDKDRRQAQEQARVVRKERPGRYQADEFRFHTDNVRVDVLAMYCIEQDAVDGAILLLDTRDITEHFAADELAILCGVQLWAPEIEARNDQEAFYYEAPLLSKAGERYRAYYIPWLMHDSYAGDAERMLERFSDYVKHKEETQLIRIPLKPRESLFIDNHRMLHGRRAIAENSKRHMVRLYLSVPPMADDSLRHVESKSRR